MLTFAKFLTERIHSGIEVYGKYAEVFKNPDGKELMQAAIHPVEWYRIPKSLDAFEGEKCFYAGGVLTTDLYIFNREIAQHGDIFRQLPELKKGRPVPLYLYFFPASNTLALEISSFSMDSSVDWSDYPGVLQKAAKSPRFKSFKHIIDTEGKTLR